MVIKIMIVKKIRDILKVFAMKPDIFCWGQLILRQSFLFSVVLPTCPRRHVAVGDVIFLFVAFPKSHPPTLQGRGEGGRKEEEYGTVYRRYNVLFGKGD